MHLLNNHKSHYKLSDKNENNINWIKMSGPPKFKICTWKLRHMRNENAFWFRVEYFRNNSIESFIIKPFYLFLQNQELKRLTLSLEFSTAATCGGILTIKWGFWLQRGNHTLAGRFRFNVVNSATSLVVFASFVGMELSNLPISISACINSSSGLSLGAWK